MYCFDRGSAHIGQLIETTCISAKAIVAGIADGRRRMIVCHFLSSSGCQEQHCEGDCDFSSS